MQSGLFSAFCDKHDPVGDGPPLCLFTDTVCTLQTEQIYASSYQVLTLALRVLAVPDFCKHAVVVLLYNMAFVFQMVSSVVDIRNAQEATLTQLGEDTKCLSVLGTLLVELHCTVVYKY